MDSYVSCRGNAAAMMSQPVNRDKIPDGKTKLTDSIAGLKTS
jgi:hypothetical protein